MHCWRVHPVFNAYTCTLIHRHMSMMTRKEGRKVVRFTCLPWRKKRIDEEIASLDDDCIWRHLHRRKYTYKTTLTSWDPIAIGTRNSGAREQKLEGKWNFGKKKFAFCPSHFFRLRFIKYNFYNENYIQPQNMSVKVICNRVREIKQNVYMNFFLLFLVC